LEDRIAQAQSIEGSSGRSGVLFGFSTDRGQQGSNTQSRRSCSGLTKHCHSILHNCSVEILRFISSNDLFDAHSRTREIDIIGLRANKRAAEAPSLKKFLAAPGERHSRFSSRFTGFTGFTRQSENLHSTTFPFPTSPIKVEGNITDLQTTAPPSHHERRFRATGLVG